MGQEIQLKLNNNNVSPTVEKVGDGNLQGFTATDLTGAANELKNTLTQLGDDVTALQSGKSAKVDLTNIIQTSPNCTVTNGIAKGTYFYLDGDLARAKELINENATFTLGTNYEKVTAGGLNSLNNKIDGFVSTYVIVGTTDNTGDFGFALPDNGRPLIVRPIRDGRDGTRTGWFGLIMGRGASGGVSVKCVDDSLTNLASTKVALETYYII